MPPNWGRGAQGAAGGAAAGAALGPYGAAIGAGIGGLAGLFIGGNRGQDSAYRRMSMAQQEERRRQMSGLIARLEAQASGEQSYSAEQLRQNSARNIAMQQAFATSARPGGAASANRIAAQQSAKISSGLAGQQALAGIQERNAANTALSGLLMGGRGQDLDVERLRSQRYGMDLGTPTQGEQNLGALQGLAQAFAMSSQKKKDPNANESNWGKGLEGVGVGGDNTFNG